MPTGWRCLIKKAVSHNRETAFLFSVGYQRTLIR